LSLIVAIKNTNLNTLLATGKTHLLTFKKEKVGLVGAWHGITKINVSSTCVVEDQVVGRNLDCRVN
jgi:hypothetical protein